MDNGNDAVRLRVLEDQVNRLQKQVDGIAETQKEAVKLVSRYIGGMAFLIGAGVFIGWIATMSSSSFIVRWFTR